MSKEHPFKTHIKLAVVFIIISVIAGILRYYGMVPTILFGAIMVGFLISTIIALQPEILLEIPLLRQRYERSKTTFRP